MAEYHYPDKIKLPNNYEPPKLAITVLYWKAWTIMLMISAHNPSTFGAFCWDHYPTMKMLMEMCITNQLNESIMTKDELQILTFERDQVIEFETYLAAQTSQAVITKENALLISQVMLMDPMGPARRVPVDVLDQLKQLNATLKLGHLLCRSRKPDLLLEIIQHQGTSQSMPWLSDLVQNSDGEFRHLPVQCLCEFLLSNAATISEDNSRDAKLLDYLRNLIKGDCSDKQAVCEVLDYIFRRLSSTVKHTRIFALSALKVLFKDDDNWLLFSLPQIPHFTDISAFIIPQLRAACQVENAPELVMLYIQFIAAHTQNDSVTVMLDHVIDMAQLIVERSTMFQRITPQPFESPYKYTKTSNSLEESRHQTIKCLFVMFNNYIIKLREYQEPYEWNQYPDLLMVQFEDGAQLPVHLNIIHAFVILLTHTSITVPESIPILDYWFPPGRSTPQAYISELPNDHVQLLPDWLKLKMIRSPVERLIGAAMYELTPDQIVLFVQNFGTPVSSMSKLLALLDHAVIEKFESVKDAILNKAYLAQLIEIQQARGAKNGHVIVKALELHSHSQTVPDMPKLKIEKLECLEFSMEKNKPADMIEKVKTSIEDIIDQLLKAPSFKISSINGFHKLIHQILKRSCSAFYCQKDCRITAVNKVLLYFNHIGEMSKSTLQDIFKSKHACTLLRALFACIPESQELSKTMFSVMQTIINNLSLRPEPQRISFARLLPIFQTQIGHFCKDVEQIRLNFGMDKYMLRQILPRVSQNSGQKLINDIVESTSTKGLVDKIVTRLQISANKAHRSAECSYDGLLVDCLVEADPELIMVNTKFQIDLMFSKTYKYFCFYFLSLLCHETNWDTLNETLNYLLQQFRSDLDQSAILNFIEALMNNPRLWKGRDKTFSKNVKPDVLFVLDEMKLQVLAQYILEENYSDKLIENIQYINNLSTRINLLYRVSNQKISFFMNCLEFVINYPGNASHTFKFLQQMYMMHPKIKYMKKELNDVYIGRPRNLNGFRTDKVANYLITCLGNLFSKKDFDSLSSEVELLMRKLAASHPVLFLRQLGVFCSQIQGKAHINIRALRDEHHLHRFIQILRTFEVLQPMLFNDDYKHNLQIGLDCYFTFFKYHIREKETYHIIVKLVELLQAYIKNNPASAFIFIEKYTLILQDLSSKFNHLVTLQQLVQGLSLLKHKSTKSGEIGGGDIKQEFYFDEDPITSRSVGVIIPTDTEISDIGIISGMSLNVDIESKVGTSLAFSEVQKQSLHVSSHIFYLIQTIKHSVVEEVILGPLQEIESITSKRFSFLHALFDRLLDLIFSHSAQVRSNAYILLIRHLKNQPGRSDIIRCTHNAFIQCLCHDNSSVASTAVDNLVELIVLLQEHSVEILGVAFLLGIKSRISTSAQIKRAMQTLMLQQGY